MRHDWKELNFRNAHRNDFEPEALFSLFVTHFGWPRVCALSAPVHTIIFYLTDFRENGVWERWKKSLYWTWTLSPHSTIGTRERDELNNMDQWCVSNWTKQLTGAIVKWMLFMFGRSLNSIYKYSDLSRWASTHKRFRAQPEHSLRFRQQYGELLVPMKLKMDLNSPTMQKEGSFTHLFIRL